MRIPKPEWDDLNSCANLWHPERSGSIMARFYGGHDEAMENANLFWEAMTKRIEAKGLEIEDVLKLRCRFEHCNHWQTTFVKPVKCGICGQEITYSTM